MIGWEYDGPFDELPAQNHPGGFPIEIAEVAQKQKWASPKSSKALHRVIAWEAVGEVEGTGIVHIAPGCGKEDFGLGKVDHLVAIAPLDDAGVFLPGFGDLTCKSAVEASTADWILANLQEKGVLFAVEKYPHSYPHCWRCKTELLFRLIDEWFIDMSWREEIKEVVKQATWLPESINGQARELDWLSNMGDWMISKKRFWGLALPIWVCDKCGHFDVIGSREELKRRAVSGWEQFEGHTPHRPWIDQVKLQCGKCKSTMCRIPDVGNPWLDAGIVPYSTMKYNTDRAYWEKWFPADFITEAFPGQFRNWFYAILAMSTMMRHPMPFKDRVPFKKLLGHGQVRDQWGEEMHKSKGNSIPFDGAADGEEMPGSSERVYQIRHELKPGEQAKVPGALSVEVVEKIANGSKVREVVATCPPMSADLIRWLYCRHNPAQNINFGPGPAEELRSKFTLKLWNCYSFFVNYAILDGFVPKPKEEEVPVENRPLIDRWILSDLQLLIRNAKESFETFNVMAFCLEAEKFVDDKLSNWYIRRNRRRFWKSESGSDKDAAYQTLYTVLTTLAKLFAPIMPFLTEEMHKNLVISGDSIHLCEYPEENEALIDDRMSAGMEAVLRLVSLGFAARNKAKIKVKQALSEMRVVSDELAIHKAIERFSDQICEELNIKNVSLVDKSSSLFYVKEAYLNYDEVRNKIGSKVRQVSMKFQGLTSREKLALAERETPNDFQLDSGDFVTLDRDCFGLETKGIKGWEVVEEFGTFVGVNTELDEDLLYEGLARGAVRQIQLLRKKAGLNMEDRIELMLITDSEVLKKAIEAHKDYIANETLTNFWRTRLEGEFAEAKVKIEGHDLTIRLRKIGDQIA
jgi:isoleucyl-tRNA synthetase